MQVKRDEVRTSHKGTVGAYNTTRAPRRAHAHEHTHAHEQTRAQRGREKEKQRKETLHQFIHLSGSEPFAALSTSTTTATAATTSAGANGTSAADAPAVFSPKPAGV
jgi:hypothetical protein